MGAGYLREFIGGGGGSGAGVGVGGGRGVGRDARDAGVRQVTG